MKRFFTATGLVLALAASAWAQCSVTCTQQAPGLRYPLIDWRFVNNGALPQTHGVFMSEDNISIKIESDDSLNLSADEIEMVLTSSVGWRKELTAFSSCNGRGQTIATEGSNRGPVHMRLTRTNCNGDTVILRKGKLFQGTVDMYHLDPGRFFRLWGGKKITINWSQDFTSNPFPPTCNFPCVPTSTGPDNGILYDTDNKADIAVWRQEFSFGTAVWFAKNSSTGATVQRLFGHPGDIPVPFDYDGDGRTDMALFRPSTGEWWVINSLTGQMRSVQWGTSGDMPAPGDYDGDGKADLAVWRPSAGMWFIKGYMTGVQSQVPGGTTSDVEAAGDYNGDHKTDPAVWNTSTGIWNIFTNPPRNIWWGLANDLRVPADYDGDGATDFAVFRVGTWYIKQSNIGGDQATIPWGTNGDVPLPRDYDGDGRADVAVFRPWTSEWWIRNSSNGSTRLEVFGGQGDVAVPSK